METSEHGEPGCEVWSRGAKISFSSYLKVRFRVRVNFWVFFKLDTVIIRPEFKFPAVIEFGFFSNISHQIMIQLTPIVSRSKNQAI